MATTAIETTESDGRDADLGRAAVIVLTTAELAECACPEFCDRDHERD